MCNHWVLTARGMLPLPHPPQTRSKGHHKSVYWRPLAFFPDMTRFCAAFGKGKGQAQQQLPLGQETASSEPVHDPVGAMCIQRPRNLQYVNSPRLRTRSLLGKHGVALSPHTMVREPRCASMEMTKV